MCTFQHMSYILYVLSNSVAVIFRFGASLEALKKARYSLGNPAWLYLMTHRNTFNWPPRSNGGLKDFHKIWKSPGHEPTFVRGSLTTIIQKHVSPIIKHAIFPYAPGCENRDDLGWTPKIRYGHSYFLELQVNAAIKHCAMTLGLDPYPQARGTRLQDAIESWVQGLQPWSLTARSLKSDRQPQMESFRGYVKLGVGSPWRMMGWKMILSNSGFPVVSHTYSYTGCLMSRT